MEHEGQHEVTDKRTELTRYNTENLSSVSKHDIKCARSKIKYF